MSYVSVALRRLVTERAKEQCEYCLFPQSLSLFIPLTPAGRVTAKILQFNLDERILEREQLSSIGKYPLPKKN
jgi:hypothetical protein